MHHTRGRAHANLGLLWRGSAVGHSPVCIIQRFDETLSWNFAKTDPPLSLSLSLSVCVCVCVRGGGGGRRARERVHCNRSVWWQ